MQQLASFSLKETGLFSKLIIDYLESNSDLKEFYHRQPSIDAYLLQIKEKSLSTTNRKLLVGALQQQYDSDTRLGNKHKLIDSLLDEKTFTVTTGHQVCVFGGPLYFIYKIAQTIRLAAELKNSYPEYNIVPIYWMATEDHDFEEINHINLFGKKLTWNISSTGAVGLLSTSSLAPVLDELQAILGTSDAANEIIKIFKEAYLNSKDLASATRYWVNEIFKGTDLLVLDANDKSLKNEFLPIALKDIANQVSFSKVNESIQKLAKHKYSSQAHPREVNFFFLEGNTRTRIEFTNNSYTWGNHSGTFRDLEQYFTSHPEQLSPNVITRPLYQEYILPNLAYIGGQGEIAYWLELKSMFDEHKVQFPVIQVRQSYLMIDEASQKRIEKLGLQYHQLFLQVDVLIKQYVKGQSSIDEDIAKAHKAMEQVMNELSESVKKIDVTLVGAVAAEKAKMANILQMIGGKTIKSQKAKMEIELGQINKLIDKLFPSQSLQERYDNFIVYYIQNQSFVTDLLLQKELNTISVFGINKL